MTLCSLCPRKVKPVHPVSTGAKQFTERVGGVVLSTMCHSYRGDQLIVSAGGKSAAPRWRRNAAKPASGGW